MSDWTPGPWTQEVCHIADRNGYYVAIASLHGKDPEEREANARLIAAAPELAEALNDACLTYAAHGDQPPQKWLDALAKAKGEA